MTLRLTLRGTLLLGLPATLAASLYAGHIFSGTPYIPPVTDDTEWSCTTDAQCAEEARTHWLIDTASDAPDYASRISEASPKAPVGTHPLDDLMLGDLDYTGVDTYEDGSGVQYINGTKVRTFPADTFLWDCTYMGNRTCG